MSKYTIADIEIFADGLDHPECVAIGPDGALWAGGEAGQIYRIGADRVPTVVASTGGFTLGIAFSPEGWLAVCDLKGKKIWRFDPDSGELTSWVSGAEGRSFQTPNYIVFDRQGTCYVSDSGEFRKHNGCIYRFSPDGQGEIWHPGPFPFANGMALSADQQTLYVVSTWLPGVEAISIDSAGRPGEKKELIRLPETCPDGIAVDSNGDLYISCYAPNCIYRLRASGELETLISDWESHTLCNPTNIAFGGEEHRDLFIANLGRWHIGRLRLETPGIELVNFK